MHLTNILNEMGTVLGQGDLAMIPAFRRLIAAFIDHSLDVKLNVGHLT